MSNQLLFILAVEFIAVAMPLGDFQHTVGLRGERARLQPRRPRAQTHGAAQFVNSPQLAQLIDDAMRSGRIEFRAVRPLQAADVSREFDDRALHSQANAEVRDLAGSGILDAAQHAGDSTLPKAAGNQDAVHLFELVLPRLAFQPLGLDPHHIHLDVVGDAPVSQRLV